MNYRKPLTIGLIVLSVCIMWGCSVNKGKNVNGKKTVSGEELFGVEFLDDLTEVVFYYPNETTIAVSDSTQLEDIRTLLGSATYEKCKNPEREGMYYLELKNAKKTAELAIDNDYLLYDGKSFKLQNKKELEKLFEIIGVEI